MIRSKLGLVKALWHEHDILCWKEMNVDFSIHAAKTISRHVERDSLRRTSMLESPFSMKLQSFLTDKYMERTEHAQSVVSSSLGTASGYMKQSL